MAKRKLTQADLEANPQLQLDGLKVGDEIDDNVDVDGPGDETETTEENTENANDEEAADDTGGSAPPPDKPRDN